MCLNEALYTVMRGKTDPVELHLCGGCTLPGDSYDEEDEWS
jgi:hypothetical protein